MSKVPVKTDKHADSQEKSSKSKKNKQPISREKDWMLEDGFSLSPEDPIKSLMNLKPFKRSEDMKGHDITVSAKFPKSYDRGISKLKELDGSPYELKSDVIRDCVYVGLMVLNMRYSLDADWQIEKRLAEQKSRLMDMVRMQEVVREFVDELSQLSLNGSKDIATERITEFIGTIVELGKEKRGVYLQALKRRLKQMELDYLLEAIGAKAS